MSPKDIPILLRHCVVAVYHKSTGGGYDGVVKAFKICRDTLAKNGYLYHRGNDEILESIQLTGKGMLRNQQHVHEGVSGGAKDLAFANLFKMVESRLYELDGTGGLQRHDQPADNSIAPADIAQNLVDDGDAMARLADIDRIYTEKPATKVGGK